MLRCLLGKKTIELESFSVDHEVFDRVVYDLGTGNGKFAYEIALKEPRTLVIGIDPVMENLGEYAKKFHKSIAKRDHPNLLFLIDSVESIDSRLAGTADDIYVNFPWGSLLEGIAKGEAPILNQISKLGKQGSLLHVAFSYSSIHETAEVTRRALPQLTDEYFKEVLEPRYKLAGISIDQHILLDDEGLHSIGTFWAKTLYRGKRREIHSLECTIL